MHVFTSWESMSLILRKLWNKEKAPGGKSLIFLIEHVFVL